MPTENWPVLMWRDARGGYCGCLVGRGEDAAATDETESGVLTQLKEWEERSDAARALGTRPDWKEWRLMEVRVEVRPQYRKEGRLVSFPEPIFVMVPCVLVVTARGVREGHLPHLDVSYVYRVDSETKGLVSHYAREALTSDDPEWMFRRIPPVGCYLRQVTIRRESGEQRREPPEKRAELSVLFSVAEPIPYSLGRRRVGATAFGREGLVRQVVERLRSGGGNLLLVGESGVGKTTILMDAARQMARGASEGKKTGGEGDAGEGGEGLVFWRGNGVRMMAGKRYLGMWQESCEGFVIGLSRVGGIFWAENLLELMTVGGVGPEGSVGTFLLPYLQRRELRMISEITPRELEACRRIKPEILDQFVRVDVGPLLPELEEGVLKKIATGGSGKRREFEPSAVRRVRRLFSRFQAYAAFPGPMAGFVRELADGESRGVDGGRERGSVVSVEEVTAAFGKRTGMPEVFLRDDLRLSTGEVREALSKRVIGQPAATEAVARLVTTFKAGMNDPGRPLGVLLFCGPTGVGKTALARAVAEYCFSAGGDAEERFVRLDMSEYGGWGAARRFLESERGEPALWLERVRRQPFCVVLFDEIEKAAPEIFDVLLSLLDEGRVMDGMGRVTWFRSAFVFLTSNLGAESGRSLGFGGGSAVDYAGAVGRFFRPEFFNRLDGVTPFRPLELAEVRGIAAKELRELGQREGLAESGLRLEWTERLLNRIVDVGFDPRLGARPLQRALERMLVAPLARWKVENAGCRNGVLRLDWDGEGADVVRIDWAPENIP